MLEIHHVKIASLDSETDPCDSHIVAVGHDYEHLLHSFLAHIHELESIDETRFYEVLETK